MAQSLHQMKLIILQINLLFCFYTIGCSSASEGKITMGAERFEEYIHLIENKNVGVVVNQTSVAFNSHIVDFLLGKGVRVSQIFAPEHGFRGEAAPGEEIQDGVDAKTGIPLVSIYGKNKKPTNSQLQNIDVMVFDIQDVGCRFYTYLSTLYYVIEACAENNIPLIVLDRPNPNGEYVAGPILKDRFKSFVGIVPVPVVHGCTLGEMANMINEEYWHNAPGKCNLTVIPVEGYNHNTQYVLPIKPSPNLPNLRSTKLYPFLCFFEATTVSIGRGTQFPFQVIGYPDKSFGKFSFTPTDIPGVVVNPTQECKICYGQDLRDGNDVPDCLFEYFLEFYHKFHDEKDFLDRENWFNLLVGDDSMLKMVREGKACKELKEGWQHELGAYKKLRKKYLIYPDFE